eukprot:6902931-Pyramimonas_sp.AAC.1
MRPHPHRTWPTDQACEVGLAGHRRSKARQLKLTAEKWIRNHGHDMRSVRPVRKQVLVRLGTVVCLGSTCYRKLQLIKS